MLVTRRASGGPSRAASTTRSRSRRAPTSIATGTKTQRIPDPGRRARRRQSRLSRRPAAASEQVRHRLHRHPIAGPAEAGNNAGGHGRDHRRGPPGLAAPRVGQVELHDGSVEGGQRVMQRPAVVGEGAGVDDDGGGPAPGPVDDVHQVALVIGLLMFDPQAVTPGLRGGGGHVILERGGPVDIRFPIAEQVEVGAGEQDHERARSGHDPSCARVARTSSAGTPATTARPAGPSRTKVRAPSVAFLSRPITAISCSTSTSGGSRVGRS